MQAFFVKNYGPLWQYLSNRKYIIVFENMEDSEVTSLEQPFMRRLGDAGHPLNRSKAFCLGIYCHVSCNERLFRIQPASDQVSLRQSEHAKGRFLAKPAQTTAPNRVSPAAT
jgi:hypothetical protein